MLLFLPRNSDRFMASLVDPRGPHDAQRLMRPGDRRVRGAAVAGETSRRLLQWTAAPRLPLYAVGDQDCAALQCNMSRWATFG